MSKQYIFRVQVLSVQETNFMQAVSSLSGETQYDILNPDKNQQIINSSTSDKVVWNNIILPERYEQQEMFRELPDYLKYKSPKKQMVANARNVLWQNVASQEARADSQLARLFTLSIPHFFSHEEASKVLTSYAKYFVDEGMIVDASIHDYNQGKQNLSVLDKLNILQGKETEQSINKEPAQDYRGYLLCTLRSYKDGYFHNKNREWNQPQNMSVWRKKWIACLYESILNHSNSSLEEIALWDKKLRRYSDYEEVRNEFQEKLLKAQSEKEASIKLERPVLNKSI